MKRKVALSIAGSDPSTGAGIQADLKTFTALDIYGTTVITCITIQNTQQVKAIHRLPPKIIENQLDTLLEDIIPNAVKTGMLFDAGDSAALKSSIELLWHDKNLAVDMGCNARKKVETEFSPEVHYDKLIALYEKTVNNERISEPIETM